MITTSCPRACAARDRVERHRARVRPLLRADQLAAGALRPFGELLDGGGAEGVAGGQQHRLAQLLLEVPGELADGRGLAGAVHADHEDHGGLGADVDRVLALRARASASSSRSRRLEGPRPAASSPALDLLLELADDLGGRRRAHVRVDQRLLEALPCLVVERLEERRLELGAERLARTCACWRAAAGRSPLATSSVLDGLRRARRRSAGDEEISPGTRHGPAG